MTLLRSFAPIVDFAFPPRCAACGEAIAGDGAEPDALCVACWSVLRIPGSPCCAACQAPFAADRMSDDALCASCLITLPLHDGIAAATAYGPTSRALVLGLKHGGRIALARALGRAMAARIPPMADDALVIPVPLHRWRLWRRGYNQSVLLGREIARRRAWQLGADTLRRIKPTPSLDGLKPSQRQRALQGAIATQPRWRDRVKGREIVLVDDVLTTGATSDACVRALRGEGAARVIVACYARVFPEDNT